MTNLNLISAGQENCSGKSMVILITIPGCEKCEEAKRRLENAGIHYIELQNNFSGWIERRLYHSKEFEFFRKAGGLNVFEKRGFQEGPLIYCISKGKIKSCTRVWNYLKMLEDLD